MKTSLIILLALFSIMSCNSSNNTNESSKDTLTINSKSINKDKDQAEYENFPIRYDSLLSKILKKKYVVKHIDTIKLNNSACPFRPYMLIVSENKLKLMNNTLDSVFEIKTGKEIQTATWSPYNPNEIFLLTKNYKKLSAQDKKILSGFSQPSSLFDLNLYKLDLDSSKMIGISRLNDYSIPLCNIHYELWYFFSPVSILNIDKDKHQIQYKCFCILDEPEIAQLASYFVNLNDGSTFLDTIPSILEEKHLGISEGLYSNRPPQNNQFKAKVSGKFVEIYDIPDGKPNMKIPISIFSKSGIADLSESKNKGEIEVNMNFCFNQNNTQIIFSLYKEAEMGVLEGNIYIGDINGKNTRLLIKNQVIGYETWLRNLNNGMTVITTTSDMYIYDSNYKQTKHFPAYQHYELR